MHVALFHVRTRRPRAGAEYQRMLDALNTAAVTAVQDMGWTASLHASGSDSEHSLRRASREADVVVLMGGDDIEPSLYGQDDRRPTRTAYERRADRMQIAVVMDAVSQRRPLLGICRGHQLLNVALGGTLHQHVPGHRGADGDPFVETAVPGIATLAPGLLPPALCIHHQAVDELGRGLHPVLHSEDGVIEAISHESLPFLGVQWHPEHPAVARAQLTGLLRAVHRRGAARESQFVRFSARRG